MDTFVDKDGREIRWSDERRAHVESEHPEMRGQFGRVAETLREPHRIVRSRADEEVELHYRLYEITPVTQKYLCVVVKATVNPFIITAFYTDSVKKGAVLWQIR